MDAETLWSLIQHADMYVLSDKDAEQIKALPNAQSLLVELSLDKKWYHGLCAPVGDLCPFCKYLCATTQNTWEDTDIHCKGCICPPTICSNCAEGGLVSTITEKYIDDMDEDELDGIIEEFQKYL